MYNGAVQRDSPTFHFQKDEEMTPADTMELARQAELLYEQHLKAQLVKSHPNQFVAIEPVSEAYYLGTTLSEAVAAARRADPLHRPFVIRIGHATAVHISWARHDGCG
jgi:hypothetical protein